VSWLALIPLSIPMPCASTKWATSACDATLGASAAQNRHAHADVRRQRALQATHAAPAVRAPHLLVPAVERVLLRVGGRDDGIARRKARLLDREKNIPPHTTPMG